VIKTAEWNIEMIGRDMKGPLRVRRPKGKIKGGEGRKSSETKRSSEDVGSH
jgi:hypothetical protein